MPETNNEELRAAVSVSMRVNLGNYQSADVFVSLSGVGPETTEADMDALLQGNVAVAFQKCLGSVKAKCREIRENAA